MATILVTNPNDPQDDDRERLRQSVDYWSTVPRDELTAQLLHRTDLIEERNLAEEIYIRLIPDSIRTLLSKHPTIAEIEIKLELHPTTDGHTVAADSRDGIPRIILTMWCTIPLKAAMPIVHPGSAHLVGHDGNGWVLERIRCQTHTVTNIYAYSLESVVLNGPNGSVTMVNPKHQGSWLKKIGRSTQLVGNGPIILAERQRHTAP